MRTEGPSTGAEHPTRNEKRARKKIFTALKVTRIDYPSKRKDGGTSKGPNLHGNSELTSVLVRGPHASGPPEIRVEGHCVRDEMPGSTRADTHGPLRPPGVVQDLRVEEVAGQGALSSEEAVQEALPRVGEVVLYRPPFPFGVGALEDD